MISFKCKMCGGDLHPVENATTCECEYCGSVQTIPTADNEKKMNLFGRSQRLLRGCEFDKAAGVYESIVAEFPEEAEAYWGLVLCKYGIEYVDDPVTGKKVPTCHRSSFDSVMEDSNFEQACENADSVARRVYRDEAKAIEELRKGIIEVSGKEEPYDIFICYKETDEKGERTLDSVLAQDIYNELIEKGYRVFFSRITLEDKLGQEYEPYIFAALNSSKVMLAVGTDYEYYNAVWVKNEWSRFLKLISLGEKKTLIPCYKNIDAYDMPKEFARLQAQDMSKVGAMQDLLRGIEKIIPSMSKSTSQVNYAAIEEKERKIDNLRILANRAKEKKDVNNAAKYYEQILLELPNDWEATFFTEYYSALQLSMDEIGIAANRISMCMEPVMMNLKEQIPDSQKQKEAYTEIVKYVRNLTLLISNNIIDRSIKNDLEKLRKDSENLLVPVLGMPVQLGKVIYQLYNDTDTAEMLYNLAKEITSTFVDFSKNVLPNYSNHMSELDCIIDDLQKQMKMPQTEKEKAQDKIAVSVKAHEEDRTIGGEENKQDNIEYDSSNREEDSINLSNNGVLDLRGESIIKSHQFAFGQGDLTGKVIVPEGVTDIEQGAFSGAFISEIVLPKTLKRIGIFAFDGCINLSRVEFQNGIEEIGFKAFAEDPQLYEVHLPESLKKIDKYAFTTNDRNNKSSVSIHLSGRLARILADNNSGGNEILAKEFIIDGNTYKSINEYAEKQKEAELREKQERLTRERKAKERERITEEINYLNSEMNSMKGLFGGIKRKKIQEQIDELKKQLRTL